MAQVCPVVVDVASKSDSVNIMLLEIELFDSIKPK